MLVLWDRDKQISTNVYSRSQQKREKQVPRCLSNVLRTTLDGHHSEERREARMNYKAICKALIERIKQQQQGTESDEYAEECRRYYLAKVRERDKVREGKE